jgi:molecular chaperone GrpE
VGDEEKTKTQADDSASEKRASHDHHPDDKQDAHQSEVDETGTDTSGDDATSTDKTDESNDSMLAQLRAEAQKNLDGWQRSRAEFTNYKKRVQKELGDANRKATLDTLSKVLPAIDDFERAINNIPEDIADNPWVSGTALIMKKFEKLLEDYDVEMVDPVGKPFDPHQHEAIGMDDSDEFESGTVTVTLQKGYVSGDRVLRPALVRVAN